MSKYAGMIAVEQQRCHSLVFDFSQLNNLEQYYEDYRIPKREKFMVYAWGGRFASFRLEGNGTIITDEAIYIHPSHREWAHQNRLPLSELCGYMVFQENARSEVRMISRRGERRIFGRTLSPHDESGKELAELLQNLQREMVNAGAKDRRDFQKTIAWVLSQIRGNLKENGILNPRYENLLSQIERSMLYPVEAAFVRAENYYRLCDEAEYYHYVDSLKDSAFDEVRKILRHPDNLFYESYIADISNASAFYMAKSLIDPYLNLKKKERLTLHECLILCFLCIRLDDNEYYRALLHMIELDMQPDDFWALSGFYAKVKNEKLSGIYEKLLSDAPLNDKDSACRDALGLTPLHYALILRNEDLVRRMLASGSWDGFKCPFPREETVRMVYSYTFLAASLYDNVDLIREVILHVNENAKPLVRAKKQTETFLYINNNLLDRERAARNALLARYETALEEKDPSAKKLEEEILEKKEEILKLLDRIEDYASMQDEIDEEITRLVESEIKRARGMAERIIKEKHPLTRYILHLYLAPDALYRSIADTITNWRVYRYQGCFFVTSVDHDLDLSYYEWRDGVVSSHEVRETDVGAFFGWERKSRLDGDTYMNPDVQRMERERRAKEAERKRRSEERRRRRQKAKSAAESSSRPRDARMPYPNSWFSPEAHLSVAELKKEYRLLVKKYHPDAGKEADGTLFLYIMNERADILERMGG